MLARFLGRQQRQGGAIPDDRTILIEAFHDQAGELGLAVLTPFGGKLHLGLKIALLGAAPSPAGRDPRLSARRRRPPLPPARTSTSRRSTSSTA